MALIKNSNSTLMARDAIVLDLGDLRRQGEQILEHARLEAAKIIGDAQRTRRRLIDSAASEGRAEGLAEGLASGHEQGVNQGHGAAFAERRDALNAFQAVWGTELKLFVDRRESMLDEARKNLLALSAMIGQRVTHRVIELDPSVVVDQLKGVLALVMRQSRLTIRVHPLDRDLVSIALPELARAYSAAVDAEIIDDPTLARGSCLLRLADLVQEGEANGAGTLDASIETQLDRIVQALLPDGSGLDTRAARRDSPSNASPPNVSPPNASHS